MTFCGTFTNVPLPFGRGRITSPQAQRPMLLGLVGTDEKFILMGRSVSNQSGN